MSVSTTEREIDACIILASQPNRLVKRLAARLVGLDLMSALDVARRLSELNGEYALDDLVKLLDSEKAEGKRQ